MVVLAHRQVPNVAAGLIESLFTILISCLENNPSNPPLVRAFPLDRGARASQALTHEEGDGYQFRKFKRPSASGKTKDLFGLAPCYE